MHPTNCGLAYVRALGEERPVPLDVVARPQCLQPWSPQEERDLAALSAMAREPAPFKAQLPASCAAAQQPPSLSSRRSALGALTKAAKNGNRDGLRGALGAVAADPRRLPVESFVVASFTCILDVSYVFTIKMKHHFSS